MSRNRRRVQYGLKFWLTGAIAIALTVSLASNYPNTRTWRLYYGYITALIVCIERVVSLAVNLHGLGFRV